MLGQNHSSSGTSIWLLMTKNKENWSLSPCCARCVLVRKVSLDHEIHVAF